MTAAQHESRAMPVPWTQSDLDNLRRDVAANLTNREIAERRNRTIESVKSQRRRHGITAPKDTSIGSTVERLVADGWNDAEIAAEVNTSERTVQRYRLLSGVRRQAGYQPGHEYHPKVAPVLPKAPPKPGPRPDIKRFDKRLAAMLTRLIAPVPAGLVLRDVVQVLGRELVVIDYSPDGDLVTVDTVTRDVVVVANPDGDVVAVAREVGVEVVVVRRG